MWFAGFFYNSPSCLFTFLIMNLEAQIFFFIFMKSNSFILWLLVLWCQSKKPLPKPYMMLVRMYNGAASVENTLAITYKVKHRLNIWSSNSIPRYTPRRIKNICSWLNVYTKGHNSIIHNSQKKKHLNIHQLINTLAKYGISILWNTIQP